MKINKRGQVTVPKNLRDTYGLIKGTEVDFIDDGAGIRLVRRAGQISKARGIAHLRVAGSVDDYIEEVRGK